MEIGNKDSNCEQSKDEIHEENRNKSRRSSEQNGTEAPVEDLVTEVVGRVNSMKRLKGIIKSGLCCDQRAEKRAKNRVHFSEENITIEIPRPPVSTAQITQEFFCYFCCFGWLFPNV